MTSTFDVKRGNTFGHQMFLSYRFDDAPEIRVDITGWQITSQIRSRRGDLIDDLEIDVIDEILGEFEVFATSMQTSVWPVGAALWDVRIVAPDGTRNSQTILVDISDPVTRL